MSKKKTDWKRNCPECGCVIYYARRWSMVAANKINSNCKSCASSKRTHSPEAKRKMRDAKLGIGRPPLTNEWKLNLSNSLKGRECNWGDKISNSLKGRVFSESHKKNIGVASSKRKHSKYSKLKMRISTLKSIEDRYGNVFPNYNPSSIPIIEAKAKELGITDFQRAVNGGEYHIKELGYFVDGYSKEKNIVIEYDEPHHKNQVEKDKQRQQEIIDYLGCKFIRIKCYE